MKKRFLVLAAAALTLSACGLKSPETTTTAANNGQTAETTQADSASAKGDAEVTLVYAEVNPLDTVVGQTGTAFKEKVEELSGGKIHIDIQASGVLGSENDVLSSINDYVPK